MRRGDNVAGIDSSEGNTVDFERAGNEENALREVLQENHALTTETTSKKDKDGTGDKSGTGSRGTDGLANLKLILATVTLILFNLGLVGSEHNWRSAFHAV